MRLKSAALLTVFILLFPVFLHALPTVSSLYGSWGVTFLIRNQDGTWEAEGGRLVINADGTGTIDTFFNNNGTVNSSLGSAFTYAAAVNGNGTITFTILTPDTETHRIILNDTADMMFMDGTRDLLSQKIGILIRLKDADYNNTDFMGDYNAVAYEYFHGPVITTYRAHAFHFNSNGSGQISGESYTNDNETPSLLFNPAFINSYNFSTFGSPFFSFVNYPGPDVGTVSANNNAVLMVQRRAATLYGLYFALKRETRAYTTADLAGKWVVVGFGDSAGTNFYSMIGAMHCNATGECSLAQRVQVSGQVFSYTSPMRTYTVSHDGTFGSSYNPPSPSYAAAIGNNGNNLYLTASFSGDPHPVNRVILVGLRSNDSAIPLETYLPLLQKP